MGDLVPFMGAAIIRSAGIRGMGDTGEENDVLVSGSETRNQGEPYSEVYPLACYGICP